MRMTWNSTEKGVDTTPESDEWNPHSLNATDLWNPLSAVFGEQNKSSEYKP